MLDIVMLLLQGNMDYVTVFANLGAAVLAGVGVGSRRPLWFYVAGALSLVAAIWPALMAPTVRQHVGVRALAGFALPLLLAVSGLTVRGARPWIVWSLLIPQILLFVWVGYLWEIWILTHTLSAR